MNNPFDQFDEEDRQPGFIPNPMYPGQLENQSLTNQKTRGDLVRQPVQAEGDRLTNDKTRYEINAKPTYDRATALGQVRDNIRQDKRILTYEAAIPIAMSALHTPENGAGDNMLVNAAAKVGDPSTGVQAREGTTWELTETELAQAKARMLKQFGSDGYGNFTPEGRTKIREAIRGRTKFLEKQYSAARAEYAGYIKELGLPDTNPEALIGAHAYLPFKDQEMEYIRRHGGTPKINGVPIEGAGPPRGDARFADEAGPDKGDQLRGLLHDGIRSGQIKTPEDANNLISQFNQQNSSHFGGISSPKEFFNAVAAAKKGQKFGIGEARDRLVDAKVAQQQVGAGEAAVAGFGDAGSVGLLPRAGAAVQAMFGDDSGSFSDRYNLNLDANREILDKLGVEQPWAYAGGSLAGGLALPTFGAKTAGQFGKLGAGYGGAYGFNQGNSETPIGERAANAVEGMAAGGTFGYALPKGLSMLPRKQAGQTGPLVDPNTGELNPIMDGMSQAERVRIFREQGLNTITPGMAGGRSGRIVEQVMNNLPASAGHMEDVAGAASKELRGAADNVASAFGTSRTLQEGGSALQRGAQTWMSRADDVGSKLYDAIPIADDAPTVINATRATLGELTSQFSSNPQLQAALKSAKLEEYASALQSGGLSWKDLKGLRSRIGYEIGEMRLGGDSPTKDQLRALYAALSDDMKNTAAANGGLRQFERANAFHAAKETQIEQGLARILGGDLNRNPEAAAAAVQGMTASGRGGGDLKTLAQVRAMTVKSGAWDEIAATMIRLGGQPSKAEGRAFSPQTFTDWYAGMTEPARALLFKPELRKGLDQFVAANLQLKRLPAMNNNSNTGPLVLGGAQLLQAGKSIVTGDIAGLAIQGGANLLNYGAAKLWTNPRFVNWATGYTRALANGNQNAVKSQMGRLSKLGATYPELRAPIENMIRAANDNLRPSLVASPEPDEEQQQQYPY